MLGGRMAGCFCIALVGDLLGRKRLILSNLLLTILGLVVALLGDSLPLIGTGLFLTIFGIQNAGYTTFYFITEKVSETHRSKFMIAIQMAYGAGILLNPVMAYYVRHWQAILLFFFLIPLLLATLAMAYFVTDTPICLLTRYSLPQALQAFKYIARVNKHQHFDLKEEELTSTLEAYRERLNSGGTTFQRKNFTVVDLFCYKSVRNITVGLIVLNIVLGLLFFGPVLILSEFELNIFVEGLVVGLSEFVSYPLCYYLITRTKRQLLAYRCFAVAAACQILLIFVWNQGATANFSSTYESCLLMLLIFVFRFAISVEYAFFFVYVNELFPTQVRVLGLNFVSVIGAVFVTIFP
jgi:MFS family permease